ncbi:hypothetical protein [Paenibacillus crassostreae]|uniref:Uncharacterized protein n=1 Tax=Paenibacillus crassostreae TaxID=1763538 RepID=A0A167FSP8_9BACL|nr:hypothetical protein [Paenibacillus crassostreae]AOZ94101.1 hypothetical protein LPB68_19190 [Paenibacillus crassostreae]OAB76863.1 hypothetical protein PNBC_05550 [Paenibacillus crassostreae]
MNHKRTLIKLILSTTLACQIISGAQISASTAPPTNGHHKHHHHGRITKDAADLLGMEPKELMSEWQKGKTLIQIAQDRKGWDEETFTKKINEIQFKKIDEVVKSGKISKEKGEMIKQKLPDKIKKTLNHKHGNHHDKQPGTYSHL